MTLISSRYTIPTAESFQGAIEGDDLDIQMAQSEDEKQVAMNARASKTWRTLRIAAKSKLNMFDKIEDGNNLQALFKPATAVDHAGNEHSKDVPAIKLDAPGS